MLFGSKKVVGLDIGTSSIKMAEMDVSGSRVQLKSFGFATTPASSLNGGEITNTGAIAVAVQGLASQIKTKRKMLAIGMWGTAVIVKKITIPQIDKKLIAEQIRWEAEQYIPFDVNDISLSYHIIPSNSSAETMDILLIAAQRELVDQYVNSVAGTGLQAKIVDVSGFALANVFEVNYGKNPGETICLLNIGAGVTNFVVVSDGQVIFSRDLPVGGFNYTNEIHKELGITLPEAESLKIGAVDRGAVPDEVQSILSATNELVTEEIRNSFEFFAGSNLGVVFSRCYITGGSSMIPGLAEQIAAASRTRLELMNPFLKINVANTFSRDYIRQIAPFAAVAMGLGLRKAGDV
jgi:type IV pilus assembly protein PilM